MRALLVDDDNSTRTLIHSLLVKRGHDVFSFAAAEPAWDEHQREPFDLAVLDWVLPGMHGLELCRRIRTLPEGDRTVVLVITGRDSPDDLQQVLSAGANDYMAKPAEPKQVIARVTIAESTWQNINQRKRAEAEAQENLERFMLAAAGTNDGFWDAEVTTDTWTSPDNVVWYSAIFKRLLGYEEHEFPGLLASWLQALHPEDQDPVFEALRRHIEDHAPYDVEYRLFTKSGEARWFQARGLGIWNDAGNLTRMSGSIRDITEHRERDKRLQKQQQLLRQILDAQERERRLISYEIHDGLVQELLGALMHLEAGQHLRADDPQRAEEEFTRGVMLLRGGVTEARRLISGLRPPILDESGIVDAVEYLVNETREMLPEVEYIHPREWTRIAPTLETAIFRVVQEALANVRRHSRSDRARVELSQRGDLVLVEVRDWGIGFDPNQVREGSFGLEGIRERARQFGGQAHIDTAPKQGTTVRAEFPLLEA